MKKIRSDIEKMQADFFKLFDERCITMGWKPKDDDISVDDEDFLQELHDLLCNVAEPADVDHRNGQADHMAQMTW